MTSNFRSARSKVRARCGSGMPSKSRNGCSVTILSPSAATWRATSAGVIAADSRSFSKISTCLKPAAAIASSFSLRSPLRLTVAIEAFMTNDHGYEGLRWSITKTAGKGNLKLFSWISKAPPIDKVEASSITARGLLLAKCRALLLEFDDLDPVRAVADRVAIGLAKLSGSLIDLVDRYAIRLFSGGNEILARRIDPDTARLGLGCVVGDVSQLARVGCHREQGDLVGRTLCRIQELAVRRDLQIGRPDFRPVILGRHGRCLHCANRNLRLAPGKTGLRRHRADAVNERQCTVAGVDRVLRHVPGKLVEHVKVFGVRREDHVTRAVTRVRADRRRLVGRELAGCAVEGELQHLIGAGGGRGDKLVAWIRQDRMCIAARRNDLDRFRFNQSVFADRAYCNLVAAVRGGEQETPAAIGRNIRHAVRKRRRRFLRQFAGRRIDGVAQYAHGL